jgi:ADP-ribose pyrophosphatase YjhB (NUDIX family)
VDGYLEIQADGWHFQLRVGGVCIWRDHVLLQRALDGDFWVLPGGRVLPLERTADALVRTLRGELGQDVAIQRLLWVMEYVTPVGDQPLHELGFYYAVALPADSPFLDLARDHAGVERGHDLLLRWFPADGLSDVQLFPEFLRTAVGHLPPGLEHVVGWEIDPGRSTGHVQAVEPPGHSA